MANHDPTMFWEFVDGLKPFSFASQSKIGPQAAPSFDPRRDDTVNYPPNPAQKFSGLYAKDGGRELTILSDDATITVRAPNAGEAERIATAIYKALNA